MIKVEQTITENDRMKLMALQGWKRVTANVEYFSKSNNWLKMHNLPMRRKPLRKRFFSMDETYNMLGIDTRNRNMLVLDIKNKARKRNVDVEIDATSKHREQEIKLLRTAGY